MSDDKPWRNGEVLRELYHERDMTQAEMAEELDCTKSCISRWMSNCGVESDRGLVEELRDRQWLYNQYWGEGKGIETIAEELGCSDTAVRYWLEKHDISTRKPSWERHIKPTTGPRGYERLHTNAYKGKEKVKFHRLVAIAEYGLEPVLEKEVHHKNSIPWDNRPSNLELVEHDEHARTHAEDRDRDEDGRFVN